MIEDESRDGTDDVEPSMSQPFPPTPDWTRPPEIQTFEYATNEGSADAIVNRRWHVKQRTRSFAHERLLISERVLTARAAISNYAEQRETVNDNDVVTWVFESDPKSAGEQGREMAWKLYGVAYIDYGTNKHEWLWKNRLTSQRIYRSPLLCPAVPGEVRALVYDYTNVPAVVPQSTEPLLDLGFTYRNQPVNSDGFVDAPAFSEYVYEPAASLTARTSLKKGIETGSDSDDSSAVFGGIVDARYIVTSSPMEDLVDGELIQEAGGSGHRLTVVDPYVPGLYHENRLTTVRVHAIFHDFVRISDPDEYLRNILPVSNPGPVWLLARVGGMQMTADGAESETDIYLFSRHENLRPPIKHRVYPLVASFTGEAAVSPDLYVGALADDNADPVVKLHPDDPLVTDAVKYGGL